MGLKSSLKAKLGASSSSAASRADGEQAGQPPRGDAAKLANNPAFAVEMAIGDPFPELVSQDPNDTKTNIRLSGVYFSQNKRYLFKKAHFSYEDRRLFDVDTGTVILVSHHEGKNPYEEIDPLGYNESATGEWKCKTTVSSVSDRRYPCFRIRPKKISRHGAQYILIGDEEVLNVAKMSKFKSKSTRPHFLVGRGKEAGKGDDMAYKIVADLMGRTLSIENSRGEVVAVMTKTTKALLKTAVFGTGSESTIDVAAGVDCSTILAIIFAVGQVGQHYIKDTFSNFIQDPIQDAVVGDALGAATGGMIGSEGAVEDLAEGVGLDDELNNVTDGTGEYADDLEVTAEEISGFFSEMFGI